MPDPTPGPDTASAGTADAPAHSTADIPSGRPRTVCLRGSTRHWDALAEANAAETLAGRMVLAPGVDLKAHHAHLVSPTDADRVKEDLDALHRAKIRAADEVLVVNKDGYIGESTRAEIVYALHLGKPIRYTETYEHAVLVTRPGLDDMRLGPLRYRHQAEQIATSLTGQLHRTAHIPGTIITPALYDPTQPHRGLPTTTDPYALVHSMDDADEPAARPGVNFPDTYALPTAWHGPDHAADLWTTACNVYDHLHADPDDENH